MNEIFDRLILFLCCTTLYLFIEDYHYAIIPITITIILSSLFLYYEQLNYKLAGALFFGILCIFFPQFIVFAPVILYDVFHTKNYNVYGALIVLFLYQINRYDLLAISFTVAFLLLSYLLKYKTDRINQLVIDYNDFRDNSVQVKLLLEQKNQNLLQNQDYEINLATLNERNRISKEIHDNVGHLLSRALLQVGALSVLSKDELVKEGLNDLKNSLSVGMDQIRSSIHNMYDESIDLYIQIEHLVKDFSFCQLTYDYDITNPPALKLKQSFIAITKESLANIMRHSDATKVNITLREHPAMYQLIIQDNGTINSKKKAIITNAFEHQEYGEGIGLRNIYDRVKTLNGNLHVTLEHGFKLFISVPKSSTEHHPRDNV